MNIHETLDGGARLIIEDEVEWQMLEHIFSDIKSPETSLASRIGAHVQDADAVEDWQDFIKPELESRFARESRIVENAISIAKQRARAGSGEIHIARNHLSDWYSTLNQARLAIEDLHHFGPSDSIDPSALSPTAAAAWMRGSFYMHLQSFLLDRFH